MINDFPQLYFDNASTTKTEKAVLDVMLPYFTEIFGNASSNHEFGKKSKLAIEKARGQVAELLNCSKSDIIFTSGATESINMTLKGIVESNFEKGNHIITVKTEHKAILDTCEYLEERGVAVTYLEVNHNGLISLEKLKEAIRPETLLIAIMYVNNETGVIQAIKEIGTIAKEYNIPLFCDSTQAIGKIEMDVERDNIDLLCFSAHKLNGPKGVGILYKKKSIKLTPLLHGGGQENGMRAGTYNTPLIVGLGKACEIANRNFEANEQTMANLNKYLLAKLNEIDNVVIIGDSEFRVNNIIDVLIPGLEANVFISKSRDIALSNGSACTSQLIQSSHVLKAMGLTDQQCNQCIRISISVDSSEDQIDRLVTTIKEELILN